MTPFHLYVNATRWASRDRADRRIEHDRDPWEYEFDGALALFPAESPATAPVAAPARGRAVRRFGRLALR